MNIISLFSGAGGLDLGLSQAGHNIVWANDIDKDAVATYRKNIGNDIVLADIKDIDINIIPHADVVVGGFPCQGFSLANLQRKVEDERNHLYKFFYRIIKEKKPNFFIAENVKGILSLGKGTVINHILNDFEEAGYRTTYYLVNMANYGIPQTRQRVIIVGKSISLSEKVKFIFPKETHSKNNQSGCKWISIKEALEHYPDPLEDNNYLNHIGSSYKVEYRNFTGHRQTDPNKPCPTILARGNGKGGVCAIPHYNGKRRLTIRESATIQTFPEYFYFCGTMNSCYRQIGNAVPVKFAKLLGDELKRIELMKDYYESCIAL
ncbi:DNA cytosine methyltransferase [Bilophila wadsworthia]|uniref:DNA cytosine methyltransferase n=1 Tax=Bilophila wadsworthia TaxID=35833 RepID=UPI0032BFDEFE